MFSAGPRRRRPSSSRPSSARSASSSSHGVPLDVRGHPLNPSASSGPKPASAPPSSRGPVALAERAGVLCFIRLGT
eukprot:s5946_g1.t1